MVKGSKNLITRALQSYTDRAPLTGAGRVVSLVLYNRLQFTAARDVNRFKASIVSASTLACSSFFQSVIVDVCTASAQAVTVRCGVHARKRPTIVIDFHGFVIQALFYWRGLSPALPSSAIAYY